MEKQPSQKPNPNPSLGQKASLAPRASIKGPKASIGGPQASLGLTPHPPMENKPSRRSAAENRMARQSSTVREGSLKPRGDSTRGSPSQAEPQARKTRAASFKATAKTVKTEVHLLNAFARQGDFYPPFFSLLKVLFQQIFFKKSSQIVHQQYKSEFSTKVF